LGRCRVCITAPCSAIMAGTRQHGHPRALQFKRIFSLGILPNHLPSPYSGNVHSFTPADLVLPTSKESIEPMDGLSLALALLAWVLIALLSFFVGIIVIRALRHVTVLMRWTLRSGLDRSSDRNSRHG
jgi:hypothetical protein